VKAIILAGGTGTRLWPLSRTHYPKQFLKLKGMDQSIFQMTIERCLKLTDPGHIYIVTNSNYKFLVSGQIEELGYKVNEGHILIEPVGKNTLPAIYYGVKEIQKQGDDTVLVLPGKKLSYQLHHHRSEHWVVVKGTAKVTVEGVGSFVRSGESTFVQTGFKHRLENPGKVLLEVIEVQLGEYLEENDIVRFDDKMLSMPGSFHLHRYGHESYWIRENKKGKISLTILQILLPYLDLIHDEDVDYIMSREGRYNWYEHLQTRPIRLKSGATGSGGKVV